MFVMQHKLLLASQCGSMSVMQAFTTDFRIHWAQHPLRPEFVESTYFIYKVSYVLLIAVAFD